MTTSKPSGVFSFGFFYREMAMFVIRVAAIIAACLFCCNADAQCKNSRCYRPAFLTAQPAGKVVRKWTINADGSKTLIFDATKGGDLKSPEQTTPVVSKSPGGLMPGEINRDSRAYAHAKREAQILANSGRGAWHPLGTAPGCSFSGCGVSSTGSPNHCYRNLGDSRIVARACVYRNGRYYWSAHLR